MLTTIVKADGKKGSQRITIPKLIRERKGWDDMVLYKMRLGDDGVVTIEGYLSNDDIKK
jgi:bifunctional DNA-binding transcriptional regulator/antitoxin component of YhaV-PrlF toxin-antitoxin module